MRDAKSKGTRCQRVAWPTATSSQGRTAGAALKEGLTAQRVGSATLAVPTDLPPPVFLASLCHTRKVPWGFLVGTLALPEVELHQLPQALTIYHLDGTSRPFQRPFGLAI